MALRRGWWKPHAYEVFVVANLILSAAFFTYRLQTGALRFAAYRSTFQMLLPTFITYLAGGIVAWSLWLLIRGGVQRYWNRLLTLEWWIETIRFIVFGLLALHVYAWIKLMLPLLRPHLYDAFLLDLDRKIFFGMNPNAFFLELFGEPAAIRFVDFTYIFVFRVSLTATIGLGLAAPSTRVRLAVLGTNAMLWIGGAWLYTTWTSLGPGYWLHPLWDAYRQYLPRNTVQFTALYANYHNVILASTGVPRPISLLLGIAAFPSLHCAFQTFIALWMGQWARWAAMAAWIGAILIFIGSLVTGWHYLVDSIAGVLMAIGVHWINVRALRIRRFSHLLRAGASEQPWPAIARRAKSAMHFIGSRR